MAEAARLMRARCSQMWPGSRTVRAWSAGHGAQGGQQQGSVSGEGTTCAYMLGAGGAAALCEPESACWIHRWQQGGAPRCQNSSSQAARRLTADGAGECCAAPARQQHPGSAGLERRLTADGAGDGLPDPPVRVGGELEAAGRLKAVQRLGEARHALCRVDTQRKHGLLDTSKGQLGRGGVQSGPLAT